VFLTESERAISVSYSWFIDIFGVYLTVLDLIDIFLAGICQIPTNSRGVFRVKHPHISELHISHPHKSLPYIRPRLLSYCALKLVHRIKKRIKKQTKNKQKKLQYQYMLTLRGVSTAHRTRTNFVRVGDLPNVITRAKFEIN